MTTEQKFKAAVNVIRGLPKNGSYQPSSDMMLRFYSYFKQATEGPCQGSRPAFWEVVNRAKYDAWKRLGDMPKETAMEKYVSELHSIVETMSYSDNVANFLEANQELDNLNVQDLQLMFGDVIDRWRHRPDSPLASREASPSRLISSLSSSPSVSPPPEQCDESDNSDDEFTDTIENPEPRHFTALSNGYPGNHVSRPRTKSSSSYVDVSQDVVKMVQQLQNDMEKLNKKCCTLEDNKQVQQNKKGFWGLSTQMWMFVVLWPFVATFITHRVLLRRK